jgi:hypothetical protein
LRGDLVLVQEQTMRQPKYPARSFRRKEILGEELWGQQLETVLGEEGLVPLGLRVHQLLPLAVVARGLRIRSQGLLHTMQAGDRVDAGRLHI